MAQKNLKLIYALKDGKITSIEEVRQGMECGYVCPACGEALIARKGKKLVSRHENQPEQGNRNDLNQKIDGYTVK